jgi:hypothetical protein
MDFAAIIAIRVFGLNKVDILNPIFHIPWQSASEHQICITQYLHIPLGDSEFPMMPNTSPVEL